MEKKIRDHLVKFDETNHRYTVDGKPVISVTKLISWKLKNKYADIDEDILKRAAEHGTKVHEVIEDYEMLGIENDIPELANYKWLKSQYNWNINDSEILVLYEYKNLFICGKLDLLADIDGFNYIFDIKTTSSLDRASLSMQLTLYKLAYEYSYDKKIDYLAYIWLNSKGNNDIRKFGEIKENKKYMLDVLEEYWKEQEYGF